MKEKGYNQGRLHVPRTGGQASSEGTSMYMYAPPRGLSLVFNLFPEEQCLVY